MDNELKAILRSIVNDLEKTAAGLAILSADVHAITRKTPAEQTEAMQGAIEQNKVFYEKLRKQIETLRVS